MSDSRPPGRGPHDPDEPDDADGAELDASDWLTSQFDPTGQVPKQAAAVPPVQPGVPPGQPVVPPVQQPQFPQQPVPPQQPGTPQQPAQNVAPPQFPVQPGTPQQGRPVQQPPEAQQVPPQFPGQGQGQPAQPQFPIPPVQQPAAPAFPPAAQQPPAQQPPAQQPPAAQPAGDQQGAGGFSWGLTPASQQQQQPAATPPAATPPAANPPAAAPPAATPPAVTPPAATPPAAPGTWFEPVAPTPAHPHEPAPLDPAIAGIPPEGEPPAPAMPFETTVLPDVAPDSRDAPPFWEPEPTQMMDALDLEPDARPEPAPRQPFTRSVFPEGTELLPEQPDALTEAFGPPAGETGAVSAIDSLFGESQFREYSGIADPNENPFARRDEVFEPEVSGGRPPAPPGGVSKVQKVLLIVLGSALAVLALVGLFFLGIRLPDLLGPAPAVVAPSASPSPSASPAIAIGPVAPGEYHWDELLGGECLDPFESAWQDDYTVVDCANPHPAQMVRTEEFAIPANGDQTYPGEEVLQEQALALCRGTGIFSPAAEKLKDGQVAASYPVSAEDWDAGNRRYYCFVSRSSGEPITGDIALPQPTPTPSPAP